MDDTQPPSGEVNYAERSSSASKGEVNYSAKRSVRAAIRRLLRSEKLWMHEHKAEVILAIVFAIVFAWPAARAVDPPKHEAYKIPVVLADDTDDQTKDVLRKLGDNFHVTLGDVPVRLEPITLPKVTSGDQLLEAAKATARDIIASPDTLLVIGHLSSGLTEASLPIYLGSSPQVPYISTTASDDNLLTQCGAQCSDNDGFVPMLQPSPTNENQADSAVRFAVQSGRRRFLIVTDDDESNGAYLKSMIKGYISAIKKFPGTGVVGTHTIGAPPTKQELDAEKPDCALYAGGVGSAQTLLRSLSGRNILVLLSDAVIETRVSNDRLATLGQVRFTYQNDAEYYREKTNVYLKDAVGIARQIIEDTNRRGGNTQYKLRSMVHMETIEDMRRNLIESMEQASDSRTWYGCTSEPQCIFDIHGHRRQNGMFHVWELKDTGEMLDVDGWHPPLKVIKN